MKRLLLITLAIPFLLALGGCLTINEYSATLGTIANPVRCDGPQGEREYLERLRGPDGEPVAYFHIGSTEKGPDGHTLEAYEFGLANESFRMIIYMDLYHPGFQESRPIEGFSFVTEEMLAEEAAAENGDSETEIDPDPESSPTESDNPESETPELQNADPETPDPTAMDTSEPAETTEPGQ